MIRTILTLAATLLATPAAAAQVTDAQAVDALATLTSYVGSKATPVAPAIPASGFDAAFYAKQNPDVVAAKVDPQAHYTANGRWEGRLPYAGAKPWRPTTPAEWASAPGCQVQIQPAWAPAGAKQVRVRFRLTRFGDGTPCERSYAMQGGGINPTAADPARNGKMNISGQPVMMAVGEVLTLPSTGSQGEFIVNIPAAAGWFQFWVRSKEWNPVARAGSNVAVQVGGERPEGTQYNPDPLVLPAPTPYPTLGKADYETNLLGDLAADGWLPMRDMQINAMLGAFFRPGWKTASGKALDPYPIVNGVRQLRMLDTRTDLAEGKYAYVAPGIRRVLGDGTFGVRQIIATMPKRMPGSDAAIWGTLVIGGWPPELDTHEGFATGEDRLFQTVHMPVLGAPTIGFSPLVAVDGRHEWTEDFGRETYRLWIDKRLVVERPNYLSGMAMDTKLSIEGPGGAGGAYDATQDYGSLTKGVERVAWWQR